MKKIVKDNLKSLVAICFLIIFCNFLMAAVPMVLKEILDLDFKRPDIVSVLIIIAAIYCSLQILGVIFKNLRNVVVNKTMANILKQIREKLFDKILKFKMKTFNKYNSSVLYTRLTADVDNLFTLFFNALNIVVNNFTFLIIMIILMFVANIKLALIGVSSIVVVGVFAFFSNKYLKKINRKILKTRDLQNREYSEMYNKNKLTYLYDLKQKNLNSINSLFDREIGLRKKYIFIHHFPYWILTVIQSFAIYFILAYALNVDVAISLGSIYLVIDYTRQCKSPLEEIFNQLEELQTCLISFSNINKILKEEDDEIIIDGISIKKLDGDIVFDNVSMKYDKNYILKNLSFKIKKGQKVTIVGRTGVGKTTIVNLLLRLYDINEGNIYIGEHKLSDLSIKSIRENVSFISQNPYIFNDSIRNNITLGDESITDNQIKDILNEICPEFFKKFNNNLDEKISQVNLSIGELQIIAFVRAIVRNANIYIFDEPTSNIDLKTENIIQKCIDKISNNSTVIIIAHRKSTIKTSDVIINLQDGNVLSINKNTRA